MIIKSFINKRLGIETSVTMMHGPRYAVSVYDLEEYRYLPKHRTFLDRRTALTYAEKRAKQRSE